MKSKKYLILFTSFILLLTFFALPGESSANNTTKVSVTTNKITRHASIQALSYQSIATTSASTPGYMTAQATHSYLSGGKILSVTAFANNSSFGNSTGTAAVAKKNIKPLRAQGKHTWSISGYQWSATTNVTYK